jgi:hypothetical protein
MTSRDQRPTIEAAPPTVTGDGAPSDAFAEEAADTLTVEVGPTLTPPAEAGAGAEGISAWLNNTRIVRLWSNGANMNSWISIEGVGWRRLHPANESAVVAMTMMAAHARAHNRLVNVRIEPDNQVHEIYVW